MKTIIVLCGGQSTEHEIALRSAKNVINELDRSKYKVLCFYIDKEGRFLPLGSPEKIEDVTDLMVKSSKNVLTTISEFIDDISGLDDPMVFPVIHGQSGEDGQIQGFLQTLGLPYIGNGIMASALCMDKGYSKQVFSSLNIPQAKYILLEKGDDLLKDRARLLDMVKAKLGLPCFIKPCNNGSSVGVTKADEKNFDMALDEALKYDRKILIEEAVAGCELEVSVLGNHEARASQPGSYTTSRPVLDYEAKYLDSGLIENVPHKLPADKLKELQDLAIKSYKALGCEGLARVDIFQNKNGDFLVNEINTLPGMTPSSLAPKLWTSLTDMTFSSYLDHLIIFAGESYLERKSLSNSIN